MKTNRVTNEAVLREKFQTPARTLELEVEVQPHPPVPRLIIRADGSWCVHVRDFVSGRIRADCLPNVRHRNMGIFFAARASFADPLLSFLSQNYLRGADWSDRSPLQVFPWGWGYEFGKGIAAK